MSDAATPTPQTPRRGNAGRLLVSRAAQPAGQRPQAAQGHAAGRAAGNRPQRQRPRLRPARHLPAPQHAALRGSLRRRAGRVLLPRLALRKPPPANAGRFLRSPGTRSSRSSASMLPASPAKRLTATSGSSCPTPPRASPRRRRCRACRSSASVTALRHLAAKLPSNVGPRHHRTDDPAHGPFVHQAWWWRSRRSIQVKKKTFEPIPNGFRIAPHTPSANSAPYKLLKAYGQPTTTIEFVLPNMRSSRFAPETSGSPAAPPSRPSSATSAALTSWPRGTSSRGFLSPCRCCASSGACSSNRIA